MSRVTVLVAAYNAGKYIRECLDSLIGQTLKDISIVCIDDASTDSTLSILKEYAAADERITRILQDLIRLNGWHDPAEIQWLDFRLGCNMV